MKESISYKNKIKILKTFLRKRDCDYYLLPRTDKFMNEFILEEDERVKWLTGFSGSFAFVIVSSKKNLIFTDGRYINQIKKEVKLPVLCKDFFIDPYQVYLAKSFGADAILIILSAIDEKTAKEIYKTAEELNMNTIVEVHTEGEARNALNFKNAIIGINNRNLKTLKTDIKTTYDLYKILINHSGPLICESGIKSEKEVKEIVKKPKINNFLIGESLLKDLDKNSSLLKRIVQINV